MLIIDSNTVKPVLRGPSKRRPKLVLKDRLLLNAGQKYCRMLQREHSAILLTFIKLPFVIKTGFTVMDSNMFFKALLTT